MPRVLATWFARSTQKIQARSGSEPPSFGSLINHTSEREREGEGEREREEGETSLPLTLPKERGERTAPPPRKGPLRRTDARHGGVGPRAGVLAPKPQASNQASNHFRLKLHVLHVPAGELGVQRSSMVTAAVLTLREFQNRYLTAIGGPTHRLPGPASRGAAGALTSNETVPHYLFVTVATRPRMHPSVVGGVAGGWPDTTNNVSSTMPGPRRHSSTELSFSGSPHGLATTTEVPSSQADFTRARRAGGAPRASLSGYRLSVRSARVNQVLAILLVYYACIPLSERHFTPSFTLLVE